MIGTLGFPTRVATATSHFVLVIMALVGTITHVANGTFSHGHGLFMAAVLSAGVVAGAQGGAILSKRVAGGMIQRLLGAALIILAARLIVSGVL